ncbi:MAG: thioesterase family protein [Cardiobacteriaceae bacterium]|nr:thioesterase family protein [Cardiobacteriaceae bacterium]
MTTQTFTTSLSVRIGDINYGQHLGHDRLVTLLHQARLDFLHHLGGSELSIGEGVGLIMRRLEVDYLGEGFLGDDLQITITVSQAKSARFSLLYQVTCQQRPIATAKTEMVAFDYQLRRVARLPVDFTHALSPYLLPQENP